MRRRSGKPCVEWEYLQSVLRAAPAELPPAKPDDGSAAAVLGGLRVEPTEDRTVVILVVKDTGSPSVNLPTSIPCRDGIPLGGCGARDVPNDALLLDCVHWCPLGSIQGGFRVSVPLTGEWAAQVPMPAPLVEKLLTPAHRRTVAAARERFPDGRYEFHYLQMLGCH